MYSANEPNITGEDSDLVEAWLHIDPVRWAAGALGGITAGIAMFIVAAALCASNGMEIWFPIKIAAIPFFGSAATEIGMHMPIIICGAVIHGVICSILGVIYAHFTITNKLLPLLGASFTWGTFSWIFMNNLFIKSFRDISALHLSSGAAFLTNMVFGFSLVSVALFDKALRKK